MKRKAVNSLRIRICGEEAERFLNMAAYHGIILRQIQRTNQGIEASVKADAFFLLSRLRRKAGVTLCVIKRRGPYFIWKKTRHRRLGIACGVLSFAVLYLMSLFIWDISFEGNLRYTDSFLLDFVKNSGYHPGLRIAALSCEELEKELRGQFPDITWVSARVEGTRLVIEIEENNTAGVHFQQEPPSSLIAGVSGIVKRIVTRQGTPMVQAGDFVQEGDLLVSGYVPIHDDSQTVIAYEQTAASADVWIAYEENFSVEIPRTQTVRRYLSQKERLGIILFDRRFCLPGSLGEKEGELFVQQIQWKLFDNFYLPIYTEYYQYRSFEEVQEAYDDDSLISQAEEKYLEYILQLDKLGVEIIENHVTIESGSESCVMEGPLLLERNAVRRAELETPDEAVK